LHSSSFVICDFDGTITLKDSTDLLLDRFADPARLELKRSGCWEKLAAGNVLSVSCDLYKNDPEDVFTAEAREGRRGRLFFDFYNQRRSLLTNAV